MALRIRTPMLACSEALTERDLPDILKTFGPLQGTFKIDGIRCLADDHPDKDRGLIGLSRTFKPIPNAMIQEWFDEMGQEEKLLPYADGELWIPGADFNEIQSKIMTRYTLPFAFQYMIFDYISPKKADWNLSYLERMKQLRERYHYNKGVRYLFPEELHTVDDVLRMEKRALDAGHEGLILRRGDAWYKQGRATWASGMQYKYVRWTRHEAIIIDFNEELANRNKIATDATGKNKRTSHKANKHGKGILGSLRVRDLETGAEFNVAGFTAAMKQEIWDFRAPYRGRTITYKKKVHGEKDAPRQPIFVGFRKD